jgi:pilus assembly protein CpaC
MSLPLLLATSFALAVENPAAAAKPPATAIAASSPDLSGEILHLVVGRSKVLNFPQNLRRVYVSNPAVLDSLIASPVEVVITAKAAGSSSLVVWNQAGQSAVYTISADLDLSDFQQALQKALPGLDVHAESQEGKVYLSGSTSNDAQIDQAVKLASVYAKEVVSSLTVASCHPKQVQLKVRIAEVDRSKLDQFGINLFSNGRTSSFGGTQQFSPLAGSNGASIMPSDLLNLFLYNSDINLGVTIKDLQEKQILQILAEPTITAISGKSAQFLSGGEFPFPVVQGTSGGLTSITIQFRPYGVRLDFTPIVNPDGTIHLKVAPEVSALDYTNAVTISGFTIPAISTRRAETEVELKDGQSFGISGLLDRRTIEKLNKVPGLGDIPLLGELFRSHDINRSFTELVVIVTPSVVDPLNGKTAEPSLPKMVVPNLEEGVFDQSLKSDKKMPKKPVESETKP